MANKIVLDSYDTLDTHIRVLAGANVDEAEVWASIGRYKPTYKVHVDYWGDRLACIGLLQRAIDALQFSVD